MDINMPILDGIETTIKLYKLLSDQMIDHLLISACTAYLDQKIEDKCKSVGMKYYMNKPVNINILNTIFSNEFEE